MLAFNTPDKMDVDETKTIQVELSIDEDATDLLAEITEEGRKETDKLKVGPQMSATLMGKDFVETV